VYSVHFFVTHTFSTHHNVALSSFGMELCSRCSHRRPLVVENGDIRHHPCRRASECSTRWLEGHCWLILAILVCSCHSSSFSLLMTPTPPLRRCMAFRCSARHESLTWRLCHEGTLYDFDEISTASEQELIVVSLVPSFEK
jgi:hypothetical protein